jgi:steroid delta-isomerase-like uncharacterized protein
MAETTTAAETLTSEWVKEFGERYFAAWNSREPERLLELMTEDVVYEDAMRREPMRGHAEVREFLEWAWRAFPDMEFKEEGPLIAVDEPRAAWPVDGWATNTGPIDPPGIPPTGKQWKGEGVDILDFRDGKIARLRIRYDKAESLKELGFLRDAVPAGLAGEDA